MNKKILLRRPKVNIKDSESFKISPPKTTDLEQRTSSFKDDIQAEIKELDEQYENEEREKIESIELAQELDKKEEKKVNKIKVCTAISVWNIDQGFFPSTEVIKATSFDKSHGPQLSLKTVPNFEKDNDVNFKSNQQSLYYHNLFDQTESSLPLTNKVVPRNIIIIQIAAILKRQLSNNMNKDVGCTIKKLPKKYTSNFEICPKFEIVLYDNDQVKDKNSIKPYEISNILQKNLMATDLDENKKLYEKEDDCDISATEVSMVECHMTGKQRLNLSAHSISTIPKLKNIFPNLTLIDLSYNHFNIIPSEIFGLLYLEELNLRNNPIQFISEEISNLRCLRVFICSFAKLTIIPQSIFLCPNIHEMDFSYNSLKCFPNIFSNLKLKILDLSGNPIRYFKKSFIYLSLDKLYLDNTWTHPIFWNEDNFEPQVNDKSWDFCDLCDQQLNDFSISKICFCRTFHNIVPVLLSFCSSLCEKSYIK